MATNTISRADFDAIFEESKPSFSSGNTISRADFDAIFDETPEQEQFAPPIEETPAFAPQASSPLPPTEPTSQPLPEQPEQVGIFEGIKQSFTGEGEQTPLSRAAPELASGSGLIDQVKDIKDLGLPNFVKIRSQQIFGASPEEIFESGKKLPGVSGFTDTKGNEFLKFPSGKVFVVNKPGFSENDLNQIAAEIGTELIASKGVGKLLKGPGKALLGKLRNFASETIAGGTAELGQALGRKATGIKEDAKEVAGEVIAGAAAVPVVGAVGKLAGKAIDKTIDVSKGLVKKLPSINKLTGFNKTTVKAESVKAAKDLFEGGQFSLEESGQAVRNAVETVIDNKRKFRSAQTSKDFTKAFQDAVKEKKVVNIDGIIKSVSDRSEQLGNPKKLKQVKDILTNASKSTKSGSNLEALHQAKQDLFDLQIEAQRKGKRGLKKIINQAWSDIRQTLIDNSDSYAKANKKFAELSPDIEQTEQLFSSVLKLKGDKLNQTAKKIFDSGGSPESVRQMKKLISEVDPDSFADLQRAHLQDKLAPILSETSENFIPKAFNKLFTGERSKKTNLFMESLSPQGKNALKNMNKLLNRLPNQGEGLFNTIDRRIGILAKQVVDFDTKGDKLKAAMIQTILSDTRLSNSITNIARTENISEKLLNKRVTNVFSQAMEAAAKGLIQEQNLEKNETGRD